MVGQINADVLETFASAGTIPLRNPSGLAVDSSGNLLIADNDNHRIVKLAPDGGLIWDIGGREANGSPRWGTRQSEFYFPRAICVDANDNVIVADTRNNRVQKLSPNGEFLTAWGGWGMGYGQFGGDGPLGVAVDEHGNVLVSDSHTATGGNHRIQKFDGNGRFITQFGSYGSGLGQFAGSVPIRQYGLDFGPGIGPGPIGPAGLALRKSGAFLKEANVAGAPIFCADCDNDRIVVFQGTGLPRASNGVFGQGVVLRPRQVAVDSKGRLFVTGMHQHEPPMSAANINDHLKWEIVADSGWTWVFDSGSGKCLGKIQLPSLHSSLPHSAASGAHSHGYGLALDPRDESIVFLQADNLVVKCRLDWD